MNRYTPQELIDLPQNTPVILAYPPSLTSYFKEGAILYRCSDHGIDDEETCYFSEKPDSEGPTVYLSAEQVRRVSRDDPRVTGNIAGDPGVYRPDVATRKEGKVRVELVDDGFPLALREVAKVMTWAQTAKGYKDHDWQNLPNAEVQLAAAASRHRTDHIKQRIVDGENIVDCVDSESKLLHKAHEAFGVLAQLELMLRGEFAEER